MRVFLDTNVLASAVATRGLCADVFRNVLASHDLVISDDLLQELSRTLREKFGLSQLIVSGVIELLNQDTCMSSAVPSHPVAISDLTDKPILSAAINGSTDVFVTGDKEILRLQAIGAMKIVSPRLFWEIMKAQQSD